jgi:hypothetical protein
MGVDYDYDRSPRAVRGTRPILTSSFTLEPEENMKTKNIGKKGGFSGERWD